MNHFSETKKGSPPPQGAAKNHSLDFRAPFLGLGSSFFCSRKKGGKISVLTLFLFVFVVAI